MARLFPSFRSIALALAVSAGWANAQNAPGPPSPGDAQPPVSVLRRRPPQAPDEKEAARIAALGSVNGRTYDQPSHRDQFYDYLRDSYGLSGAARAVARSLYEEAQDKPSGWGQDFPGFMQRIGSNVAINGIDGTVRFGLETLFREDMRYIPCHGCSAKRKIMNVLLAEVTARHDRDGHRFFTLTPAIADFSGPIIANYSWYPSHDPFGGVVATRTVAATRVGQHLFVEFVWERRHRDRRIEDDEPLRTPGAPPPASVQP